MNNIIENIKQIRRQKLLTQKDIAEKLGLTPAGYQKIEVGSIELTYNKLQQIADVFGMSVTDIINYPNVGADNERVKELEIIVYNQNLDINVLKESLKDKKQLMNHQRRQLMEIINLFDSIIGMLDVFHYILKNEKDTAKLLNFKTHYNNWAKEKINEQKQYYEELITELESKKTLSSEDKETLRTYKRIIVNINKALDNPVIQSPYYLIFGSPDDIEDFVSNFINKLKLVYDFLNKTKDLEHNDMMYRRKIYEDFLSILYK